MSHFENTNSILQEKLQQIYYDKAVSKNLMTYFEVIDLLLKH